MSAKRKARQLEKRDTIRFASVPCPSGKLGYFSKADAKTVARRLRKQGDNTLMNAYRCESCGLIHIGHLPLAVRNGEVSRGEYFAGLKADTVIFDEGVAA